jgi:hypothetical protein
MARKELSRKNRVAIRARWNPGRDPELGKLVLLNHQAGLTSRLVKNSTVYFKIKSLLFWNFAFM